VKQNIQAKMEKVFMDYYLLDDTCIHKYATLEEINQLNSLEKCLLIDSIVKNNGDTLFAKKLAERMKLEFSIVPS
jgi:hypothetical protein